ncbi:MAG: hypothetical protein IRY99_03910 [Isosphaeraceae bacterium]|nr:hypothetical protein [Isosphaeraceae bacterium]
MSRAELEGMRALKEQIRREIDGFASLKFGDRRHGELPMRADVLRQLKHRMFKSFGGTLELGGITRKPTIEMDRDGTVSLSFREGRRIVRLDVRCACVIRYEKSAVGRGHPIEEGDIIYPWESGPEDDSLDAERAELRELFDWLVKG